MQFIIWVHLPLFLFQHQFYHWMYFSILFFSFPFISVECYHVTCCLTLLRFSFYFKAPLSVITLRKGLISPNLMPFNYVIIPAIACQLLRHFVDIFIWLHPSHFGIFAVLLLLNRVIQLLFLGPLFTHQSPANEKLGQFLLQEREPLLDYMHIHLPWIAEAPMEKVKMALTIMQLKQRSLFYMCWPYRACERGGTTLIAWSLSLSYLLWPSSLCWVAKVIDYFRPWT